MAIEVLTAASDKRLTTLTHVKDEIGISGTDDDDFIERLIDEVSDAIVSYTNREFAEEKLKEDLPGYDSPYLVVSRTPLQSISEVKFDDTVIETDEYSIGDADSGFILRIDGIWISTERVYVNIDPYRAPLFPEPDWVVTYTGGYILPNWSGTRNLPYDVERACIEGVKARFLARQRDPNLIRHDIADVYQAEYERFGLPKTALHFLEPYRRIK